MTEVFNIVEIDHPEQLFAVAIDQWLVFSSVFPGE
jgi:hypothetical protein